MKFSSIFTIITLTAFGSFLSAQTEAAPESAPAHAPQTSIALSPAIVMVRCKPGQSTTQTLTIANHTADAVAFSMETEDVVVREGKRSFWPAGQVADGIATSSVISPASLVVKPGEEGSVQVTLTLPRQTAQRAVVTFFHAGLRPPSEGVVGLGASLGTLITFNASSDYRVEIGALQASVQSLDADVTLSEELRNSGSEPILPAGVIVILNASGKRMAKALFDHQRLLPGERLLFTALSPVQLAPGLYRTLSSFEFEGKVSTVAGEFTITE
jgi:hypothetical protein